MVYVLPAMALDGCKRAGVSVCINGRRANCIRFIIDWERGLRMVTCAVVSRGDSNCNQPSEQSTFINLGRMIGFRTPAGCGRVLPD